MTDILISAIDHVKLAMPKGGEQTARHFYAGVLNMIELPKPPELAKRGGCWFQSGVVQIHVGVDKSFHPAVKAHPALRCRDYSALVSKLRAAGVYVRDDFEVAGTTRCHVLDPWGNRIELISQ